MQVTLTEKMAMLARAPGLAPLLLAAVTAACVSGAAAQAFAAAGGGAGALVGRLQLLEKSEHTYAEIRQNLIPAKTERTGTTAKPQWCHNAYVPSTQQGISID